MLEASLLLQAPERSRSDRPTGVSEVTFEDQGLRGTGSGQTIQSS